jgi:hypothetical protein
MRKWQYSTLEFILDQLKDVDWLNELGEQG